MRQYVFSIRILVIVKGADVKINLIISSKQKMGGEKNKKGKRTAYRDLDSDSSLGHQSFECNPTFH